MTLLHPSAADSLLGTDLDRLDTPTVLVDLDVLERNVARMAHFAAEHGVALRPHVKSHKTTGIARRQVNAGARGLTVAKLDEAEALLDADERFDDIFVAYEVVGPLKSERLARLQRRGRVSTGVDDLEAARGLADAARRAGTVIPVLVEVDSGLQRAGTLPGEPTVRLAVELARLPGLDLRGIFTHAGHAYGAHSREEVAAIGRAEGEVLVDTARQVRAAGVPCDVVSVGSTPTAFHAGAVPGVTEIRPGNYVFYDRMQIALGSCRQQDCALTVLTTVISRPTADRVVVDAGGKTFALDRGAHGLDDLSGYGQDVATGLVLDRLSEEHGIFSHGAPGLHVGDRLRVIPNHACTTSNLAEVLVGIRGNRVAEILPVAARGGGK